MRIAEGHQPTLFKACQQEPEANKEEKRAAHPPPSNKIDLQTKRPTLFSPQQASPLAEHSAAAESYAMRRTSRP